MYRYLLWRLQFEICNIKRWFGHGAEQVKYLAFGANLSDLILRQRRMQPLAVKPFTLRNHGLRFDHPAPHAGCGYASAEYAPGESVYGVLYTLSERDAARMDFYEMVPVVKRYRRTWVEQDGERLYFYQTNRSTPGLKPTMQYLGYIVDGLREHPGVDPDYQMRLATIETGKPGKLVSTYLAPQAEHRRRWLHTGVDIYQKMTLAVFLHLLYRFSLTAIFIRQRKPGTVDFSAR